MDFGIAKHVSIRGADGGRVDGPSMTSTGEIAGTPGGHRARAVERPAGRFPRRHLRAWRVPLRDDDRHTSVHEGLGVCNRRCHREPGRPPGSIAISRTPAAGARARLSPGARQGIPMNVTSRSRISGSNLGAVELPQTRTAIAPPVRGRARPKWQLAAVVALGIAAAGVLALWLWPVQLSISQRALAFNERDSILITDFENLTSDPGCSIGRSGGARRRDCAISVRQRLSPESGAGNAPAHEEGRRCAAERGARLRDRVA